MHEKYHRKLRLTIAVILAHVYIGWIGMEGAYDAMGTGFVDENWAREHHSLWMEEIESSPEADSKPDSKPDSEPDVVPEQAGE